MDKIYKIELVGDYDVYKEKYFKIKDDALKEIENFKIIAENLINEECRILNLKWLPFGNDICKNNIIDGYFVYYEWEKHFKDCNKYKDYKETCNCELGRIENNLGQYSYNIIVKEIELN